MNQDLIFDQTGKRMKTLTNPIPAPIYTRARAHAHTCEGRKSFPKSLLAGLAMMAVLLLGLGNTAWGQVEFTASQNYTAPTGYYISRIECWGAGGSGVQYSYTNKKNTKGGGGGGGGGYVGGYVKFPQGAQVNVHVASQNTTAGADGDSSYVKYPNIFLISAHGGGGAYQGTAGKGAGQGSGILAQAGGWYGNSIYKNGDLTKNSGGNGADGYYTTSGLITTKYHPASGGGGAGAGAGSNAGGGSASKRTGGAGVASNPGEGLNYLVIHQLIII